MTPPPTAPRPPTLTCHICMWLRVQDPVTWAGIGHNRQLYFLCSRHVREYGSMYAPKWLLTPEMIQRVLDGRDMFDTSHDTPSTKG